MLKSIAIALCLFTSPLVAHAARAPVPMQIEQATPSQADVIKALTARRAD